MWTFGRSATLMRELRARVIDISQSGCLIQTRRRLDVGMVGTLQLQRCQAVARERSLYHVAVRFLWTTPRHICSIRYAVALHAAEFESGTIRVM
jgi:hypothetical protein